VGIVVALDANDLAIRPRQAADRAIVEQARDLLGPRGAGAGDPQGEGEGSE
jgi:hypothetical protein